jgi:hypothetical protein
MCLAGERDKNKKTQWLRDYDLEKSCESKAVGTRYESVLESLGGARKSKFGTRSPATL